MCSIFGAFGNPTTLSQDTLEQIRTAARDRGRDGGRMEHYFMDGGRVAWLGSWRATPTPEVQHGKFQPYLGMVHNGTIANDADLGIQPGEVDSEALARHLRPSASLEEFVGRLRKVQGSYAVAMVAVGSVFAAANYKPLWYWVSPSGDVYFSSLARHFRGIVPFGQAPVQLDPYTAIDFATRKTLPLPRQDDRSALVVCSGGLDSTTVAALLVRLGRRVRLLHFRYGCQAEAQEQKAVEEVGKRLGCDVASLALPKVFGLRAPLVNGGPIAEGVAGAEYAHEWVPARNLVMLSLAAAYAEAHGFHAIALGNNLEESGAYPDNEEQFIIHVDDALHYAVQNGYRLRIEQPVGHLMKHEIVKLGLTVGAPYDATWSCYRAGARHCGACGPCFMRRTAFERNGVADPVLP